MNNYNGNNVPVYNAVPTQTNQLPDFALGSPAINTNTLDSINYIQNPVVATGGNVLIATSGFDKAVCLWKTLSPQSGQAPDIKSSLKNLDGEPVDKCTAQWAFCCGRPNQSCGVE